MGETIAVFGAKGMLGSDLARRKPPDTTVLPFGREVDISDSEKVETAVKTNRPSVAVNVASYNDVDKAETEFDLALRINQTGPSVLAKACREADIPLIHVSTDYVYSGRKNEPYVEIDAADPVNRYGESKLRGEREVRKWEKHYILRTSSLYGRERTNHAERMFHGIQNGQNVKAADDLICHPTFTGDLAEWIYQLIQKSPPYGIYHLVHKNACTRYQFAEWMCEALGAKKPYPLVKLSVRELHLPASRPLHLELSVSKWEKNIGPLSTVREGLGRYLSEMNVKMS